MHEVRTNAELAALHGDGTGLVFNFFTSGSTSAQYNVLHSAGCPWVRRMVQGARPTDRPSVRKVFFADMDEATSWLQARLGPQNHSWKRCAVCMPSVGTTDASRAPAATVMAAVPEVGALTDNEPKRVDDAVPGTWPTKAAFAIPDGPALRLPIAPQLTSFNKKSDPEQMRLAAYLDVADELLRSQYERLSGLLALRLDVGLPRHVDLLEHRDLDNYLYPLAYRLWRRVPQRLVSVWGTKRYAADSFARIEQAVPASGEPSFGQCHTLQVTASSQSAVFKEQIRDQLRAAAPLPPGPVRMQLCFTVGAGRNWLNLWKPAIDALGQIIGHESPGKPWSPCDGRVVELGLHCRVDAAQGNAVAIFIGVSC